MVKKKQNKFDKFWEISKNTVEELTTVDDRRHANGSTALGDIVLNMALAISAPDLYKSVPKHI